MLLSTFLTQWAPALEQKIPEIRKALLDSGCQTNLKAFDTAMETLMFKGYREFFVKTIETQTTHKLFPIVLCHNDLLEGNVLINNLDGRKLLLIDYEYAGWNPMAFDLAAYLNETMLNNSHPSP